MENRDIDPIIEAALKEDMPRGDVTSDSVVPEGSRSSAVLLAKEKGVLAGMPVAKRVFQKIDTSVRFMHELQDGSMLQEGTRIARLDGDSASLLKGERTALNFLQRMSGIASETRKYVQALKGTETKILDTRKTTPGLRVLEKYAVKVGGGQNHRFSLSDMVILKDNHIKMVGSIPEAVKMAKAKASEELLIEVETTCLEEVKEALTSGADRIMLDNMTVDQIKEVVAIVKGRAPLEVSGNVDLKKIPVLAGLGVDFISVGRLTHSYKSLDISMDFL